MNYFIREFVCIIFCNFFLGIDILSKQKNKSKPSQSRIKTLGPRQSINKGLVHLWIHGKVSTMYFLDLYVSVRIWILLKTHCVHTQSILYILGIFVHFGYISVLHILF